VTPWQVNFLVPSGVATGTAQVKIASAAGTQTASNIAISGVAPSLFTLNGSGLAAAYAVRVSGSNQTVEPVYTLNGVGTFSATPINMGSASDQVYLVLYGTGLEAAGTSGVTATVNGVNTPVVFAGSQPGADGLDQVNLKLPATLAGTGNVNVQVMVNGTAANPVQITIQ
jgi:uncharacterized protein (TIGR03437 family)